MPAKYELKKTPKGRFMFSLKAGNGEVILISETYQNHAGAIAGVKSVQENGANRANFDVRTAKNGQIYFVLKAKSKEIIGRSEMYDRPAGARSGIAAVIRNAGAPLEEIVPEKPSRPKPPPPPDKPKARMRRDERALLAARAGS